MLQYRVTFQLKSPIFWSILYSPRTICTITQDKISFLQGQDPPVENDIKLSCLQLFPSKNSCVCRIKWWSCWVCQNANSYTTNYSSTNFCLRVSCKLFGYIFIVCLLFGDWGSATKYNTSCRFFIRKSVCESDCDFVAGLCHEVTMISAVTWLMTKCPAVTILIFFLKSLSKVYLKDISLRDRKYYRGGTSSHDRF